MANLRNSLLLLCFTLLSHVARVNSIPCNQIGTGYYETSTGRVKQLWPFTANQGFDIIDASACYIRFQNPGTLPDNNNSPAQSQANAAKLTAARVTQAVWTTTQEDYINTCNSFTNFGGTNSQLWLTGGAKAFLYAGFLRGGYAMTPQSSLTSLDTVITFLLPSGVAKVETVSSSQQPNCIRMQNAGGIGISGTVDPQTDYAYSLAWPVAMALAKRYPSPQNQAAMVDPAQVADYAGPFALAENGNGDCVVIDFRTMPAYLLENNNDNAGVCSWKVTDPSLTGQQGTSRKREFWA